MCNEITKEVDPKIKKSWSDLREFIRNLVRSNQVPWDNVKELSRLMRDMNDKTEIEK